MKTSGGLTKEREMDKLQRPIWMLPIPVTPEVNRAMQEFTGVKNQSRDQDKDLSFSRIQRGHQYVKR